MGRTRRSRRTPSSHPYRTRYNLRSRSKKPNYADMIEADNSRNESSTSYPALPVVTSVDFHAEKNSGDHRTDKYNTESLVLRRGQVFKLSIHFNRSINDNEAAYLMLLTGRTSYPSKGTLLSFSLGGDECRAFGWIAKASTKDKQVFDVDIEPSSEAIIGIYSLTVQVSNPDVVKSKRMNEKFYLIFNPWCKTDDVYVADEDERNEYVLNDSGRIWVGSAKSNYGKPWNFGQFEKCSLEVALHVLGASDLADNAFNNPVLLARKLSKMTNSADDDGILEGNWSGDYSGGVEPTDWSSSVAILEKYNATHEPVKYGQCWVFSGLLTTLFRALGLPARSVTNFESAHDTDLSMTIDRHWNYDGEPLTDLNDSIWNFHVWNEIWTRRPDLPDGYDGWQAVDATPQECSEGVMQCGPAPVNALKEGAVFLPYDAKFILAEVNGDIIEWVKDKRGNMKPVYKEPHSVGVCISTKAVGKTSRNDVTDNYKYKEGSEEERAVAAQITKYSSREKHLIPYYEAHTKNSVKFDLDGTGTSSGDIDIHLNMTSLESNTLTVDVSLTSVASYYHGMSGDVLRKIHQEITLKGKGVESLKIHMAAKDYLNTIPTDATVTIFCKALVKQTGQRYFAKDSVEAPRPCLRLSGPRVVHAKQSFAVDIRFENELSIPLTQCRIDICGPGVEAVYPVKLHKKTIAPGEVITQTYTLKSRLSGVREVIAHLHTRQMQNITGILSLDVQ